VVGPHFPDAVFGRVLGGAVSRKVAFDVAAPVSPQTLAPEATEGEVVLPALT
jgi:hypothetical protein